MRDSRRWRSRRLVGLFPLVSASPGADRGSSVGCSFDGATKYWLERVGQLFDGALVGGARIACLLYGLRLGVVTSPLWDCARFRSCGHGVGDVELGSVVPAARNVDLRVLYLTGQPVELRVRMRRRSRRVPTPTSRCEVEVRCGQPPPARRPLRRCGGHGALVANVRRASTSWVVLCLACGLVRRLELAEVQARGLVDGAATQSPSRRCRWSADAVSSLRQRGARDHSRWRSLRLRALPLLVRGLDRGSRVHRRWWCEPALVGECGQSRWLTRCRRSPSAVVSWIVRQPSPS